MTRREAAASGRLLPPAHPLSTTVRRVGMRVAKAAAEGHGGGVFVHMRDVEWEFSVVANPVPNAFVVPGGKVGRPLSAQLHAPSHRQAALQGCPPI